MRELDRIPAGLTGALRPVTIVVGHYGAGKTNFASNLALDLARGGAAVTVVDLDIVNPYFRVSEQRSLLEERGITLIAPVFAEAGTSLDVPSLRASVGPALENAGDERIVIVDVGGDDAGSVALGRFARIVEQRDYAMLYVANRFRNLVQEPEDAVENLREIEAASHLKATALVNNSHLKDETTAETIALGESYARDVAGKAGLSLVCTTVPIGLHERLLSADAPVACAYPVVQYVKTAWE